MLLYLIRHGDPIYNPDSLTERGKLQAQALAKRLARYGLDRIYSSPSMRAVETAEPTCALTGLQKTILPWATEELTWKDFSYVHPDGQRSWCYASDEDRRALRSEEIVSLGSRWYEASFFRERGINAEAGERRMREASDAFLKELGYQHEGREYRILRPNEERVAVFCHQCVTLAWLGVMMDLPLPVTMDYFTAAHTGMTVIEFINQPSGFCVPLVLTMSNDSHLLAENLPTHYQNRLYF